MTYAQLEKLEHDAWQEAHTADPVSVEPFNDWKTPEAEYERIKQETEEAYAMAAKLPHGAIGIRPLLALAVTQCATDTEAQEVIEQFYEALDESASK